MSLINIESLVPKSKLVIIKHPVTGETEFDTLDGKRVQLEIEIVGRNSSQWLDFMKGFQSTGNRDELFSRINDQSREFIASLIVGWTDNGALKEPYSDDKAIELVSNPENTWLLEQLQEALIDETNFF